MLEACPKREPIESTTMEPHRWRAAVERLDSVGMGGHGLPQSSMEPGSPSLGGAPGACRSSDVRRIREQALDPGGAATRLAVRGDPGWHRVVGPKEVEREAHRALAGIVIELQTTASTRQVVELAGLLRLADQPLGDGLPRRPDTDATVSVMPHGRAARLIRSGQWADRLGARRCR